MLQWQTIIHTVQPGDWQPVILSAVAAADQLLSATGRGIVSHTSAAVAGDDSHSALGEV